MTLTRKIHVLWANPYIPDGLVAHWDGIWNAAPGKHDAGATAIRELIGGYDLSTSLPLEIGENYFRVKADNRTTVKNIDRLIASIPDDWTVELVGDFRNYETTEDDTNVLYFDFPRKPIWGYVGGSAGHRVGALTTAEKGFCIKSDYTDKWTSLTYCSDSRIYGCGTTDNLFTFVYFKSLESSILSSSGKFQASTAAIHAIRIYSRCLSAAEIHENYLTDKLRFGIN